MPTTNFKNLRIWEKGMDIVSLTYALAKLLPQEETFSIRPQIIRSAVSIPSNIAEGSGRNSTKEFIRLLNIAQGSCYELETQIIILKKNEIIKDSRLNELLLLLEEEEKMISSFVEKLEDR